MSSSADHIYLDLGIVNNDNNGSQLKKELIFSESRSSTILDNPSNYELAVARFEVDTPNNSLPLFVPLLNVDGVNTNRNITDYTITIAQRDIYSASTCFMADRVKSVNVEWSPEDQSAKLPNNGSIPGPDSITPYTTILTNKNGNSIQVTSGSTIFFSPLSSQAGVVIDTANLPIDYTFNKIAYKAYLTQMGGMTQSFMVGTYNFQKYLPGAIVGSSLYIDNTAVPAAQSSSTNAVFFRDDGVPPDYSPIYGQSALVKISNHTIGWNVGAYRIDTLTLTDPSPALIMLGMTTNQMPAWSMNGTYTLWASTNLRDFMGTGDGGVSNTGFLDGLIIQPFSALPSISQPGTFDWRFKILSSSSQYFLGAEVIISAHTTGTNYYLFFTADLAVDKFLDGSITRNSPSSGVDTLRTTENYIIPTTPNVSVIQTGFPLTNFTIYTFTQFLRNANNLVPNGAYQVSFAKGNREYLFTMPNMSSNQIITFNGNQGSLGSLTSNPMYLTASPELIAYNSNTLFSGQILLTPFSNNLSTNGGGGYDWVFRVSLTTGASITSGTYTIAPADQTPPKIITFTDYGGYSSPGFNNYDNIELGSEVLTLNSTQSFIPFLTQTDQALPFYPCSTAYQLTANVISITNRSGSPSFPLTYKVSITRKTASQIISQDLSTGYYNCYSAQWWICCVNKALARAFTSLPEIGTANAQYSPYLVLDPLTGLVTLLTPSNTIGLYYVNFAVQSSYTTGGTTGAVFQGIGATPVVTHYLFFNEPLYNLFSSLPSIYYGNDFIKINKTPMLNSQPSASFPYAPFQTQTELDFYTANPYYFNYYIQPQNYNYQNLKNGFYSTLSEYSPIPMWSPIQSIRISSSLLPNQNSYTTLPIPYNQLGGNANTQQNRGGNNSQVSNKITDLQIGLTTGYEYKPTITYTPKGEYRLIDLVGSQSIQTLDFIISYINKYGEEIPFRLGAQCGANLKLLFRRKRFNLLNVAPYDTN